MAEISKCNLVPTGEALLSDLGRPKQCVLTARDWWMGREQRVTVNDGVGSRALNAAATSSATVTFEQRIPVLKSRREVVLAGSRLEVVLVV